MDRPLCKWPLKGNKFGIDLPEVEEFNLVLRHVYIQIKHLSILELYFAVCEGGCVQSVDNLESSTSNPGINTHLSSYLNSSTGMKYHNIQ